MVTRQIVNKKPLCIYKASAGSGKTFTLATEYIKLMVKNPQSYRNTLAVTFTNKATEEMKMRILSQLYGIWMNLEDSLVYMSVICKDLDASPEFVSRQAGIALRLLMHNYSYFKVETIDSFFQNILRNLARELDLTANLRIELNDLQIEEQAVGALIEELDINDEILRWIISYIKEKISDDKGWNVIGQIKSFGRTIFKDFYKEKSSLLNERLAEKDFFTGYIKMLKKRKDDAEKRMTTISDTFFDILSQNGLGVEDFPYGKSGVCGFFLKLKDGIFDDSIVGKRVIDCLEDADRWCSKSSKKRDLLYSLALERLMDILRLAIDERPKQWCHYKSSELTLQHIYQLRLLNIIEKKVRELNEEANRFLLSDTQHLLHSLMRGSDSPFIFEKIGTLLENVMIDEFQDTSSVQWQNFKVPLMECMSHEQSQNLIVGDVKQSIYRWRSGDWRLLNNISSQFLTSDSLDIRTLKVNYRSQRNIISFNNTFFNNAANLEYNALVEQNEEFAQQLKSAYEDVEQEIPESRNDEGFVSVRLLPADDYMEATLKELISIVCELSDNGIASDKMAILVRTNNYIPVIAKYFMDNLPEVSIVSDEAFRLDASTSVSIIIQALRFMAHQDDVLAKVSLIKTYQHHILNGDLSDGKYLLDSDKLDAMLPDDYIGHLEELRSLPLYDLAEQLYSIFNLQAIDNQSAYVCAFYDALSSFAQDNIPDIDAFLYEWENSICRKTIQSDEINGIRLISIHKSKGLEFDNVIIPFCDWQLEKTNGNVLWCQPDMAPYNALPVVPIDYSRKGMMGTIYEKDYLDEHLQNCVDNLNLLYVAFTRASRNLFVIGKRDVKNSRSMLIQECLPLVAETLEGAVLEDNDEKDSPISFTYGTISKEKGRSGKRKTRNVFLQPVEPLKVSIKTYCDKTEFKQSNQSRDFIVTDDSMDDKKEYIKMGCILHNVFSNIETADDVDTALRQMEADGIIGNDMFSSINTMLRKRLADKRVADWFSGKWDLFNECSILTVDDATGTIIERRPDRVMTDGEHTIVVDFKFGVPHAQYYEQVHEYMNLLSAMGHKNVEGYLWFVYSNKIERV